MKEVILFALLYGALPFYEDRMEKKEARITKLQDKIRKAQYCFHKQIDVSDEAKQLVRLMLNPHPMARIDLKTTIAHEWFRKDLPEDWNNKDFQEEISKKQEQIKQSNDDIEQLVNKAFGTFLHSNSIQSYSTRSLDDLHAGTFQ
eukprot:TRINITY_DN5713_c0_g3_i4.p4 TRINITY_DN5713_c0_g3~~TRINITY_DN5713_c0_g3_i4.p4  ORF type:complete len:145 (+),score=14.81 TRINITY_DN5713_c0_g3_i4:101-535(+)